MLSSASSTASGVSSEKGWVCMGGLYGKPDAYFQVQPSDYFKSGCSLGNCFEYQMAILYRKDSKCFYSCTTNASWVISTNRLDGKAASIPDRFTRSSFSNSVLLILPVEINNSAGSPVIRKDCTKSASLLTTIRPSCLARAITSWSRVRFFRGRSRVCNASCPASFSQLAKRRGSCASTRNFMPPNVPAA